MKLQVQLNAKDRRALNYAWMVLRTTADSMEDKTERVNAELLRHSVRLIEQLHTLSKNTTVKS